MASALHAAASSAGLDTNGNPVPSDPEDTSTDAQTHAGDPPSSGPQTAEKADAPTTPETVAAPLPDTKPKGPIPFQRHEAILKTTRDKVATETREAVEREIGPWRQVMSSFRPEEFAPVVDKLALLSRDPVAFHRELSQELQRNGLLPSEAPAPAQRGAAPTSEPEPDLVNPDTGELLYSAPQLQKALAYRESQIEARIRAELRPLMDTHWQTQNERELAQVKTTAEHHASEAIAEASQWEGFDELKPKIAALMRQDRRYSLEGAYNRVFQSEYLPNLKQRERASVVAELNQKGRAASSSVSPQSRSQAGVSLNGTKDFHSELRRVLEETGASL